MVASWTEFSDAGLDAFIDVVNKHNKTIRVRLRLALELASINALGSVLVFLRWTLLPWQRDSGFSLQLFPIMTHVFALVVS